MNGIALFTEFAGWGSFNKIVIRFNDEEASIVVETIKNRVLSLDAKTERGNALRDRGRSLTVKYIAGIEDAYFCY